MITGPERVLYDQLWDGADREGLVPFGPATHRPAVELGPLLRAGVAVSYVAVQPRWRYVWLPYYMPLEAQPASVLPPPSLQNGEIRQAYFRRDDWLCHLCGGPVSRNWSRRKEWPSPDHIVPRVQGGSDYPSNIATSHLACNLGRGDRPIEHYQRRLVALGRYLAEVERR